jgi:ammonia channel protein AmtB
VVSSTEIRFYAKPNGDESDIKYRVCADQSPQLGAQFAFIFAATAWVGITSGVRFGVLNFIGILRVSNGEEGAGLDTIEHGGRAFAGAVRRPSFKLAPPPSNKGLESALTKAGDDEWW